MSTVSLASATEHIGLCNVWVPYPTRKAKEGKINISAKKQFVRAMFPDSYRNVRCLSAAINARTRQLEVEFGQRPIADKISRSDGWTSVQKSGGKDDNGKSFAIVHAIRFWPFKVKNVPFVRKGVRVYIDISSFADRFKPINDEQLARLQAARIAEKVARQKTAHDREEDDEDRIMDEHFFQMLDAMHGERWGLDPLYEWCRRNDLFILNRKELTRIRRFARLAAGSITDVLGNDE
jgi:hypothetical protein